MSVNSAVAELACTYATLILHNDGISVTPEKISKLLKAANVTVETYWPTLFAKLAEKKNLDDLILNAASGGSAAAATAGAGANAAVATASASTPVEEKKEEIKEESDEEEFMLDLFG